MKLSILFVFVAFFCCIQTLRAEEDEVTREEKFWKKLEELMDILDIEPNPVSEIASKLPRKRFLITSLLFKGISKIAGIIHTISGVVAGKPYPLPPSSASYPGGPLIDQLASEYRQGAGYPV